MYSEPDSPYCTPFTQLSKPSSASQSTLLLLPLPPNRLFLSQRPVMLWDGSQIVLLPCSLLPVTPRFIQRPCGDPQGTHLLSLHFPSQTLEIWNGPIFSLALPDHPFWTSVPFPLLSALSVSLSCPIFLHNPYHHQYWLGPLTLHSAKSSA